MGSPAEPPPDYELSTFSHRHTMLAIAPVEADPSTPVLVDLYHWRPPTLHKLTSARLAPGALSGLKDSVSLGTFAVPVDIDISDAVSGLLTCKSASSLADDLTPQTLANLVGGLNNGRPESSGETPRQFFTFPFLSSTPGPVLGPGLFPVWKWVNPDGTYRKAGFWEADLHEALEHGEWNGGKNLSILMGGVSEATRQMIAFLEMPWRFSSLERAKGVSERGGYT